MKLLVAGILLLQLTGGQPSALNDKLVEEFTKITGYNVLDQKYKDIKSNKTGLPRKSQNISEIFIKRLQILQKTVEKVESRLKTYVPPELDEDSIMWARNMSESLCDLHERGPYKQPICLKNSSVHIPVDIFKGDKNMLRNISWSSLLDEVWVQNMATHPDLIWQYFGSTSGLLRFYPGTSWPLRYKDKEDEDIDLYDVRRRSWFVQGMSLPKDMLILIDSSGSSQGQALALMKHITRSLLETLNENDQINILTFPQDTNEMYRPPCFSSFVKATFRNKQVALDYTKRINSTGIANFSKALEASFAFFENITSNVSEGFSGSHCNQMIMLLTDGGNEKPREVLRKYNSLQKIRIFTYLIGPISTDAPAIKWIAEKSRGKFYQIPSIVAIRSESQDYIRFLSESKANLSNPLTWTSASLDYLNNELVVSVTAPLFNKSSEEGESNKTILGVLGIDLPVRQFVNSLPYDLGEYGYFFIINSQGYVLYHPRLLDMKEEFLNVDILDLEADVNMDEIRRKMIEGEKGETSVDDFDDMLDEHHVNVKRRTYRYEPIQGTEFSICVVLYDEVKEGFKETKITGSVDSEIFFTIHDTDVILDDSKYCSDEEEEEDDEEESNSTEIERFSERITKFKCDVDKLKSLIFDILQTNSTGNLWTNEKEQDPGILIKFIETSNMFRLFPQNSSEILLPKYLNYKERISKSQQWFVTVYDEETTVDNETAMILLVARRITNGNLTLAVVGSLVLEQWFQNIVFEELVEPDNRTDTISYLLDDGGIIISTNLYSVHSPYYVGQFFGKDVIEGEVMKDMIKNGIYRLHRSTGYLANCRDLELAGFSPRLESFLPFMELFSPKWWISICMTQLLWLTSVFQVLMSFLEALATGEVLFEKYEVPKESEYCAKEFFKYAYDDGSRQVQSHSFDCGNCTKSYSTEMFKDLNILLVKVTSEDGCRCPESSEPLKFKPQPNLNETHLRSLFYRKYVSCRPYLSEVEESYSSGFRFSPSLELLFISLMIVHRIFCRVILV